MKVLLPAAEVTPIIKLGGLGDVIGSLPKALEKLGVDVDVMVPYFPVADISKVQIFKSIDLHVPFGGETHEVCVYKTKIPESNVDVLLLKYDRYFGSGGKNAFAGNTSETELFTFFDRCVVEYVKTQFNTYDLIHCNDWHTGLIPHMLEDELGTDRPATLFTVHNLLYQGKGSAEILYLAGIIPGKHPSIDWDILDGDINLMQEGLMSADFINAVSPTYAQEILTHEYAFDMADIIKAREGRITGILNGIDSAYFPRSYDDKNVFEKKKELKKALQKKLGLTVVDKPIFSFIGRLDPYQKGIDILFDTLQYLVKDLDSQFILLGSGNKEWEDRLNSLSEELWAKNNVSINTKFDQNMAQEIYSGADFLIVPSRYEPCGLIQMIAIRYGTLPIVRATGGLKDSVKEGHNGYLFPDYTADSLRNALTAARKEYLSPNYNKMVINSLNTDFSWDRSAKEYYELYKKVVHIREESL